MVQLAGPPDGHVVGCSAMTPMKRPDSRLRDESGVTLVELLWVMVLGVLVVSLALLVLNFAVRTQSKLSSATASTAQGRVMMERVTRELRQSSSVSVATPTRIVFITWVKSASCGGASASVAIQCQVEYSCAAGACTRYERNVNGTGSGGARQLVKGLLSSSVFTYPTPDYVGIVLSYPADPHSGSAEDAVTLSDGVNLRNSPL